MKKTISTLLLTLLLSTLSIASAVEVEEGTRVLIRPKEEINADDWKVGENPKWEVVMPIKVNGEVAVPSGTEVISTIVKKKNNFIFGIKGSISIDNFKINTIQNQLIPMQCSITDKGNSRVGTALIGGWLIGLPLFLKGQDGKIDPSRELNCYTLEKFEAD